ncbi:MAG: primosomal protein N' [Acidobacteriota bacterium]
MNNQLVEVALPLPIINNFIYKVPEDLRDKVSTGKRVRVSFKNRHYTGFIVNSSPEQTISGEIKEVEEIIDDEVLITEDVFLMCKKVSEYFFCSLGELLSSIPLSNRKAEFKDLSRSENLELKRIPDILIEFLKEKKPLLIKGSRDERINMYIALAINEVEKGKNVLILFPEVSDLEYFEEIIRPQRLKTSFISGKLSKRKKEIEWVEIKNGMRTIISGTFPVLFYSIPNLSLIIIDGEEGLSYIKQNSPKYNIKEVAFIKAQLMNSSIILGSDSPSVESIFKVKRKDFSFYELDNDRKKSLRVKFLRSKKVISDELKNEIDKNLKQKNKMIFFVNRKGLGSFLVCNNCGFIKNCKNCNIPLRFHQENLLICHFCGYSENVERLCPGCKSKLRAVGWFGTERVYHELKSIYPEKKIEILDLERCRSKKAQNKIWQEFLYNNTEIMIGTQLILSYKHFDRIRIPLLVLLNPESSLSFPDYRFSENTFHIIDKLLLSVEDEGKVIVQSSGHLHYSIISPLSFNNDLFYKEELLYREIMQYPPFFSIVKLLIPGRKRRSIGTKARKILETIKIHENGFKVYGPNFAPISKLKGLWRVQLILKGDITEIRKFLRENIDVFLKEKINIEINPLSTL